MGGPNRSVCATMVYRSFFFSTMQPCMCYIAIQVTSPILCSPSAIMGPRKRGSGSNNVADATTPSKRCKPTEAETPDKVLAKAKHAETTFSVIKQCMKLYDDVMEKYGRIDLALDDIYKEDAVRTELWMFTENNFPPNAKVRYAHNLEPGTCATLRPWMLPWSVHSGNSGLTEFETQRNLILLILYQGFQTDAEHIGGVTKLLVTKRIDKLFCLPTSEKVADVVPDLLKAHDMTLVKGWRRSVSLNFVIHAIKELNLMDEVKLQASYLIDTIGTIHAIVGVYGSEEECIDANRDLSAVAAATRSKPNAFNHLHQLDRKIKLGVKKEGAIEQFSHPKFAQGAFGIGKGEAQALVVLASLPPKCVDILKSAAVKYGMSKGPLTHAAMGYEGLVPGADGETLEPVRKESMTTDADTCHLMCRSAITLYEQSPPGRLCILPDLALANGVLKMSCTFMGCDICNKGFATILGVGWSPRLMTAVEEAEKGIHLMKLVELFVDMPIVPEFKAVLDEKENTMNEHLKGQFEVLKNNIEKTMASDIGLPKEVRQLSENEQQADPCDPDMPILIEASTDTEPDDEHLLNIDLPCHGLEVFSGKGNLSREFQKRKIFMKEVDLINGEDGDMKKHSVAEDLNLEITDDGFDFVHVAPPCETFSHACHPKRWSKHSPSGKPKLPFKDQTAPREAEALIKHVVDLCGAKYFPRGPVFIENPATSLLWKS